MAAQDLAPTIGTAAGQPQQAASDGLSVQQYPIDQLTAADRYLAQKAARSQKFRGLMFSKVLPAGAMPDSQTTGQGGVQFDHFGGGLW